MESRSGVSKGFARFFFQICSSIYFQFGNRRTQSFVVEKVRKPATGGGDGEGRDQAGRWYDIFSFFLKKTGSFEHKILKKRCQPGKSAGFPSARGLGRVGRGTGFNKKGHYSSNKLPFGRGCSQSAR